MIPSKGVGESAAIAAMVTVRQLTGTLQGKKSSGRVRQHLNLTPLPPHPPPLMNQSLDQKQTLGPLRQTKCLKRKLHSLKKIPTCPSLWTTLGRTLHLLMSLQMLRVVNCIWIRCWIQHNPTLHALVSPRGDATGDRYHREAPKWGAPTMRRKNPMETQNQFQIYHWRLKIEADYINCTASTSIDMRDIERVNLTERFSA